MKPSKQSSLIEQIIIKSWFNKFRRLAKYSSESLVGILFFIILVVVVDYLGAKYLYNVIEQQLPTELLPILVRDLSPLIFGVGLVGVWTLRIFNINSQPPAGIIQLPFNYKDWSQANLRIIKDVTLILLLFLFGPFIFTVLKVLQLPNLSFVWIVLQGFGLLICGNFVGAGLSLLTEYFSGIFKKFAQFSRNYISYAIFLIFIIVSIFLYVKLILLKPIDSLLAWWVPGASLDILFRSEMNSSTFHQTLSWTLFIITLYLTYLFYKISLILPQSQDWSLKNARVPKLTSKIPLGRIKIVNTAIITLKTLFRDGDIWLLTLITLSIPITFGMLIGLFKSNQFSQLYASIAWVLIPLGMANVALVARSKLGQFRYTIYQKPLSSLSLVAGQFLALSILSVSAGLIALLICSYLASLAINSDVFLQFSFFCVLCGLLAYVVGLIIGAERKSLASNLITSIVYLIALLPLVSFDQWLRTKELFFRIVMISLAILILLVVSWYSEEFGVSQ